MKVLVLFKYTLVKRDNAIVRTDGMMLECPKITDVIPLFKAHIKKERYASAEITSYLTEYGVRHW